MTNLLNLTHTSKPTGSRHRATRAGYGRAATRHSRSAPSVRPVPRPGSRFQTARLPDEPARFPSGGQQTPLFKGLLVLLAALRVARSGLPMRQVERPQQSEHPGLAVADVPAFLHPLAQIDDAPPRDFVHCRIGTARTTAFN